MSRAAKGADCKSAGYAFAGSSPASPTIFSPTYRFWMRPALARGRARSTVTAQAPLEQQAPGAPSEQRKPAEHRGGRRSQEHRDEQTFLDPVHEHSPEAMGGSECRPIGSAWLGAGRQRI